MRDYVTHFPQGLLSHYVLMYCQHFSCAESNLCTSARKRWGFPHVKPFRSEEHTSELQSP